MHVHDVQLGKDCVALSNVVDIADRCRFSNLVLVLVRYCINSTTGDVNMQAQSTEQYA